MTHDEAAKLSPREYANWVWEKNYGASAASIAERDDVEDRLIRRMADIVVGKGNDAI